MNNKKVKTALIGCGDVAIHHHIPAIMDSDDFILKALCDINCGTVNELGKKYGIPAFTDYNEIMRDSDIEAVIIATPPWITPKIICSALTAGKYILSEKPMALDLNEAEKIRELQNAQKKSLIQIGFTYRHDPLIIKLKEWIKNGTLGSPLVFRMGFFDEIWDPEGNPEHYERISKTLEHGCPSVHDGAHAADYLNFLTDSEVVSVQSAGFKSRPEFKNSNYDLSFIYFKNGDMAKLEIGWFYPVFPCGEFEVLGPLGYVSYNYHKRTLNLKTRSETKEIKDNENWWKISFKNQLDAFSESIKTAKPCVPGVDEGIFSLALCKKIEDSINNNTYNNYSIGKEEKGNENRKGNF